MNKIRVFTAFSGYDSQCIALDRIKRDYPDLFDYELIGWSEIDRCAINAHNILFPYSADKNFGDISKINWFEVPDFDLFTYSFPCQDISIGGFRKGLEEGTGTRSSLLWECRKTVEIKRPKYLLMENVDQILSKTHKKNFDKWCKVLEGYGYRNFYKMLNSMDYGVPQSRKRVFMVSILGDEWFDFPKEFKLKKCLLDIVEKDIPDEEYFSKETITEMFKYAIEKNPVGCRFNNIHLKEPQVLKMRRTDEEKLRRHNFGDKGAKFRSGAKYYDIGENCCANTVTTVMKDNILIEPKEDNKGVKITLDNIDQYIKVRNFTPRENFRLMDVDDEDIDKIMSVTPKSQCLKLAGNSIVVSFLYHIFKKKIKEKSYKISLF